MGEYIIIRYLDPWGNCQGSYKGFRIYGSGDQGLGLLTGWVPMRVLGFKGLGV